MTDTRARAASEESMFRRSLTWHQECDFVRVLASAAAQATTLAEEIARLQLELGRHQDMLGRADHTLADVAEEQDRLVIQAVNEEAAKHADCCIDREEIMRLRAEHIVVGEIMAQASGDVSWDDMLRLFEAHKQVLRAAGA